MLVSRWALAHSRYAWIGATFVFASAPRNLRMLVSNLALQPTAFGSV